MSTIRCPQCNLVNWATAAECKRCRFVLQGGETPAFQTAPSVPPAHQTSQNPFTSSYTEPARQAPPFQSPPPPASGYGQPNNNYGYNGRQQPNYGYNSYQQPDNGYGYNNYQPGLRPPSQNLKSGLGIASMVLGILGLVTSLFLVGFLLAPIGFILGIVALVKARSKPQVHGGKGFAIAGLATSLCVLPVFLMVMAIAIPNVMAARKAANEGSAISSIRSIVRANPEYRTTTGQIECWALKDLVVQKGLNEGLADGEHLGYRFAVNPSIDNGCEITATPRSISDGNRSFYYSTREQVLRFGFKQGAPATRTDPALPN